MTGDFPAYEGCADANTRHQTVNSAKEYVRGDVHTNTMENGWSLFKRSIIGSYHQISVKHLDRYLDELGFRFNNRFSSGSATFLGCNPPKSSDHVQLGFCPLNCSAITGGKGSSYLTYTPFHETAFSSLDSPMNQGAIGLSSGKIRRSALTENNSQLFT
jgi:hypothetical protein